MHPQNKEESFTKPNKADLAVINMLEALMESDPEIALILMEDIEEQRSSLKLIPSENYSSVLSVSSTSNFLTNKYAEGCIGKRYYQGCGPSDKIEQICEDRLMRLFPGFDSVNVQPHCGSDANLMAFCAVLSVKIEAPEIMRLSAVKNRKILIEDLTDEEIDSLRKKYCSGTICGLQISCGGHLTHGSLRNISSKLLKPISYHLEDDGSLSYSKVRQLAITHKPLILVAGTTAYPRNIDFAKMREIADECGSVLICDIAHIAGLVASGCLKGEYNPLPYADILTSTTHKSLRCTRGGVVLAKKPFDNAIKRGCPMMMGGPLMHIIASKAVGFAEALSGEFMIYGNQILKNSRALADAFNELNVPLFTGGTDNHLMILDTVSGFGLTGKIAAQALESIGLIVNANYLPKDNVMSASGVRLGTPAITSRGLLEDNMRSIAHIITEVLNATSFKNNVLEIDRNIFNRSKQIVQNMCEKFPLYPGLPSFKNTK